MTIEITGSREELARTRRIISGSAARAGFSESESQEVLTAVFEACVNAIIHGRREATDSVSLTISVRDHRFEAVVRDKGSGFDAERIVPLPSPSAPEGRGIFLMKTFMDEVIFEQEGGCKVTLRRSLPAGER